MTLRKPSLTDFRKTVALSSYGDLNPWGAISPGGVEVERRVADFLLSPLGAINPGVRVPDICCTAGGVGSGAIRGGSGVGLAGTDGATLGGAAGTPGSGQIMPGPPTASTSSRPSMYNSCGSGPVEFSPGPPGG